MYYSAHGDDILLGFCDVSSASQILLFILRFVEALAVNITQAAVSSDSASIDDNAPYTMQ